MNSQKTVVKTKEKTLRSVIKLEVIKTKPEIKSEHQIVVNHRNRKGDVAGSSSTNGTEKRSQQILHYLESLNHDVICSFVPSFWTVGAEPPPFPHVRECNQGVVKR